MAFNPNRLTVNAAGKSIPVDWIYYNGTGSVASGRDRIGTAAGIKGAGFFGDTRDTVTVGPSGITADNPGGDKTLVQGRTQVVSLIEEAVRSQTFGTTLGLQRSIRTTFGGGVPALVHAFDALEWVHLILVEVTVGGVTFDQVQVNPSSDFFLT